jgi:hypothetical protein
MTTAVEGSVHDGVADLERAHLLRLRRCGEERIDLAIDE